ncbi:MAG: UDP-3-O-(3-hydroxymyristoyl)glucosamine N-acyltransferase [Roseimicrobium sp.]
MNTTLKELAELVGGRIVAGDPATSISGFNSIQEAEQGDITFLGNSRYAAALRRTLARAVLTDERFEDIPDHLAVIRMENPTLGFSSIIQKYGPQKRPIIPGVHPTSVVSPTAQFDPFSVTIGPHAFVDQDVIIGAGSYIGAGACLEAGSRLGEGCVIHPNVVIRERCLLGNRVIIHSGTVIGTDGFGYEFQAGKHTKIDQVGIVQIDDDVEIGSCTTIDRARFGRTWIGEGTKIDNLVQIAHNCTIGKHCIIVSQVGISGSTRVGNYVTFAGQVGVVGHLNIGDQTTFLAKSGLTKDYTQPGTYTGFPARPLIEGRRVLAYPARVPELLERIRELEGRVAELDGKTPAVRRRAKREDE